MITHAPHSVEAMCRAGGTTARGLRFWEEQGLLGDVARSEGNTRRYTDAQLNLGRIIAAAQFGNFPLDQIKEMLESYDAEVYDALLIRLSDQVKAAIRLGEQLPKPAREYDL